MGVLCISISRRRGPQTGGGNGPDAVRMDGQGWTCEFDVLLFVFLGFVVLFGELFGVLMIRM